MAYSKDFTVIIDSIITYIDKEYSLRNDKKVKTVLYNISNFCEGKKIPHRDLYLEYQPLNTASLRLQQIAWTIAESDSWGYWIVLSQKNNTDGITLYKYNPTNNLGTCYSFKDIKSRSDLLNATHNNYVKLTTIVIEGDFLGYKDLYWDVINFMNSLFLTYKANVEVNCNGNDKVNMTLTRYKYGKNFTIGKLTLEGKFICYTLEDPIRLTHNFDPYRNYPWGCNECKDKVYQITAIPKGTYLVKSRISKFGLAPGLYNLAGHEVPCFTDVLMHMGTKAGGQNEGGSWGCILMGSVVNEVNGTLSNDGRTFMDQINNAIKNRCAKLTII